MALGDIPLNTISLEYSLESVLFSIVEWKR